MKDRKRYIDEILDISIIEIKEKDQIKDEQYLEIEDIENDSLYKTESKQTFLEKKYKDIPIYAIGYPTDNKITVSFGNINNIIIDKTAFIHSCDTDSGSSGSPIFSKESFKVFSVHTGYYLNNSKNTSVLIFDAIKKFLNINKNIKN
jgi:V8-like Glu-specific endopeptidase